MTSPSPSPALIFGAPGISFTPARLARRERYAPTVTGQNSATVAVGNIGSK